MVSELYEYYPNSTEFTQCLSTAFNKFWIWPQSHKKTPNLRNMSKECKWVWVEIEEFGDGNMQNSSYLKTKLATDCSLLIGLYKYIPVSIHVEKQAARWDSVALFLMGNIVHS